MDENEALEQELEDHQSDHDCDGGDRLVTCDQCHGSGLYSNCPDDLCHGREECIHGDDATCSRCDGEGEVLIDGC